MHKIKITLATTLLLFGLLNIGIASATILFDFSGICYVGCDRFGLADGTTFDETAVLGLYDGTDTSAGADLLISDFEFFTLFGIDFLTGNTLSLSVPGVGFFADDLIGGFILSDSGVNGFCYDFAMSSCVGGDFDTFVAAGSPAPGGSGHGPGMFTRSSAVPAPSILALLGLGLAGMVSLRRKVI